MSEEPIPGCAARGREFLHVGDEVPAREQHEVLGLESPLVGVQRQVGAGQGVVGGGDQQQRRRADAGDVGGRLVFARHLHRASGSISGRVRAKLMAWR